MLKSALPENMKPQARNRTERKLRHKSRAEKQSKLPKVREGRPLVDMDDERSWMDL
jgi:hypothetical protein